MAITQTMTTNFKIQVLQGLHNFGPTSPNTFKIALYSSTATLNADTATYTTTGEITGTGYTAGGNILTVSVTPTNGGSGTTAYVNFSNISWPAATFTTAGASCVNC